MAQKLAELQVLSQENEVLKLRSAVLEAVTSGREYHVSCLCRTEQTSHHACWLLAVIVCWPAADTGISCNRSAHKPSSPVKRCQARAVPTMCTTMCVRLLWVWCWVPSSSPDVPLPLVALPPHPSPLTPGAPNR